MCTKLVMKESLHGHYLW